MIGLFIFGGAFFGVVLLASVPFSTLAVMELGLRGARFLDLFRTVFVSLVAVACMTVLAVFAASLVPPYGLIAAIGSIERTMRLVIWAPELVTATAFGWHAFLNPAQRSTPRTALAGLAMAASAEALLWMKLVFLVLPGFPRVDQPSIAEVIDVALAGVSGVLALIVPGWAIGRVMRWPALNKPPRFAWTIWPCWILGSITLRLYGPALLR